MSDITYGIKRHSPVDLAETEARLRAALAAEGFGILTEIDVAETLRQKLGIERKPYRILGACNPQLAAQALESEADIGLLMPCNVIVYEDDDATVMAALDPAILVDLTANPAIEPIAAEVLRLVERALEAAGGNAPAE